MGYHPKIKQRALELVQEGYVAQKIADILSQESKGESKSPCERTIRRWKNKAAISTNSEANKTPSSNWIEAYKDKHKGGLPLIPEWMSKVVVNYSPGARVSKNMELSIPSAQWWNGLLCSQKEQVLQAIDWLGQNRQDYLEMINRQIPGRPSDIRLIPKRKTT